MISDVIDVKAVEKSLEEILETSHIYVVCIDPEGKVVYANAHFLKVTGYALDQIAGKNWYHTFIPVNKIEPVMKKISAIVSNKYYMESEDPFLKKDGGQVIAAWHNIPLMRGAKCQGVLCLGFDISARVEIELLLSLNEKTMRERAEVYLKQNKELEESKLAMLNLLDDARRLEEELQQEKHGVERKVDERTHELNQEKARLLASINSFPYGFIVTDNDGEVITTNQKLESIFDIKKTEWTLADLQDFLGEAVDLKASFEQVKSNKVPTLLKNIDLERKFLDIFVSPVFMSPLSFETIGYLIIISDITEQKVLERSKDEFFSIASHELRTPLTAIRGNIELIKKHFKEKVNDPTFTEMVDDIHSSSERLIELVNEFLNMSRLEQGKMHFNNEFVDIKQIISEIVLELRANAEFKGLKLEFIEPATDLPGVIADANRVREIAINLISNAINYTDKGSVTISVNVDKNDMLKVSVQDTGKGIPPQNQSLLFRKLQQANANLYTRESSRSTGLGLYISKLMVEEMKGSIFLEHSEVGIGSKFSFTLPIAKEKKRK